MDKIVRFNEDMLHEDTVDPNAIYIFVDRLNGHELVIDCPNLLHCDFTSSDELRTYVHLYQPELHFVDPDFEFFRFQKLGYQLCLVPSLVPYLGGCRVLYYIELVDFQPDGAKVLFRSVYDDQRVAHRAFSDWMFYYLRFEDKL